MNTHSWLRAVPPTKTAGPMARAGFTLALLNPIPARWMASSDEPDGHRGVEVAAGDRPQRVGEHNQAEAEGEGDADVADGRRPVREGAAEGHDGARAQEHEQKSADELRDVLLDVALIGQRPVCVGSAGVQEPLGEAVAGE